METRTPGQARPPRERVPARPPARPPARREALPVQPRPQAAAPRSPRPPPTPGVPVLRSHLSPPGCRPPWLPSGFRRRRRHCRDASRAGAAAAAAGARVRPSVRPSGGPARSDLTCAPLGSGAHPATRPLLLLSRLSLRPPGGPGLRASCWDAATTTGTRGRSGEETRMATAGGAKMEPASCLKQSRSRNALRCLRSVPLAERHRGRAEEAGRGGAWGAWPRRVAPPRAAWTSREPPSFQGQRST